MVAIGMGVSWLGYSVALYGYCLAKQYKVGFLQLVAPTTDLSWPPPMQDDVVNNQTPQPTVMQQYLAPLTLIATSIADLIGGLGSAAGGVAGAVGGGASTFVDRLGKLLRGEPLDTPQFSAGEVPGGFGVLNNSSSSGTSSGGGGSKPGAAAGSGWGVTDLSGGSGWTVTNLGGR
jgi:hypothetical protein